MRTLHQQLSKMLPIHFGISAVLLPRSASCFFLSLLEVGDLFYL